MARLNPNLMFCRWRELPTNCLQLGTGAINALKPKQLSIDHQGLQNLSSQVCKPLRVRLRESCRSSDVRQTDPKRIEDLQWRNQGTSMIAVVRDLKEAAPDLISEMTILS